MSRQAVLDARLKTFYLVQQNLASYIHSVHGSGPYLLPHAGLGRHSQGYREYMLRSSLDLALVWVFRPL